MKLNGKNDGNVEGGEKSSIRAELGHGVRRSRAEDGPIVRFQSGLVEYGADRARQSGTLEPKQEDISTLVEHATAMARDAHRPKYDAEKNPNDRLREDRFGRNMERRRLVAEAEEYAEVALRDAEREQARVPPPGGKPELPLLMAVGAVVVLALTVTATLRDFLLADVEDDLLAWGLSFVMSLGFGVFLAYGSLGAQGAAGDAEPSGRDRKVAMGGIVAAVALGVWRASGAESLSDILTALGLTGVEVGVIVILEWAGKRRERALIRWHARGDAREVADSAVAASKLDLERRREELARLEEAIEDHVAYVEDRTFRNLAIEDLSRAATTAVRDGYNAGVAENRGRIRGPRR